MSSRLGRSLSLTYPVFLGYLSVGFIFGVLVRETGQNMAFAFTSALVIYAGAAQFLMLSLIKSFTSFAEAFVSIFLLNLRHVFYFSPIQNKLPRSGFSALYSIFALTDETFALLTDPKAKKELVLFVVALNHIYWILGCLLGALAGPLLATRFEGLDFALVALFVVLLIEKLSWTEDVHLICFVVPVSVALWLVLPKSYFAVAAILTSVFWLFMLKAQKNGT